MILLLAMARQAEAGEKAARKAHAPAPVAAKQRATTGAAKTAVRPKKPAPPKPTGPLHAQIVNGLPVLTAQSAILIDATSGQVLWQHNPDVRMYPASLTKMMTGLLAVQSGRLDDTYHASKLAATTGESSINLQLNEPLKLREVLEGSLIKSANDATIMVAESVAGSVPAFVEMMNAEAARMGLTSTHFVNPHGLHDPMHYSTARDLSELARQAMANETFASIVGTREAIIPWTGKPWARKLVNRNRLLLRWPLCDGVKTGYTREAGRCLAASAAMSGWRLICVVLKCKDSWGDAQTLLNWGYDNYEHQRLARTQEVYHVRCPRGARGYVEASPRSDLFEVVRRGEFVQPALQEQGTCTAPVQAGQVVGRLTATGGASVDLVAIEAMPLSVWARAMDMKIPHAGAGVLVLLAAGVLMHGASAKATRARRRRQQARQREADPTGPSDDRRATGTFGK